MFDIGFSEIFLIAVVALLVLGPERLPKAARFTGLWVRRARAQWYSVKAELENELADEELKRSLQQTRAELEEARDAIAQSGAALQQQVQQAGAEVQEAWQHGTGEHGSSNERDTSERDSSNERDSREDEVALASATELEEPPPPAEEQEDESATVPASPETVEDRDAQR